MVEGQANAPIEDEIPPSAPPETKPLSRKEKKLLKKKEKEQKESAQLSASAPVPTMDRSSSQVLKGVLGGCGGRKGKPVPGMEPQKRLSVRERLGKIRRKLGRKASDPQEYTTQSSRDADVSECTDITEGSLSMGVSIRSAPPQMEDSGKTISTAKPAGLLSRGRSLLPGWISNLRIDTRQESPTRSERRFIETCVKMKMALMEEGVLMTSTLLASELFEEAQEQKLSSNRWEGFIRKRLLNPEPAIDLMKRSRGGSDPTSIASKGNGMDVPTLQVTKTSDAEDRARGTPTILNLDKETAEPVVRTLRDTRSQMRSPSRERRRTDSHPHIEIESSPSAGRLVMLSDGELTFLQEDTEVGPGAGTVMIMKDGDVKILGVVAGMRDGELEYVPTVDNLNELEKENQERQELPTRSVSLRSDRTNSLQALDQELNGFASNCSVDLEGLNIPQNEDCDEYDVSGDLADLLLINPALIHRNSAEKRMVEAKLLAKDHFSTKQRSRWSLVGDGGQIAPFGNTKKAGCDAVITCEGGKEVYCHQEYLNRCDGLKLLLDESRSEHPTWKILPVLLPDVQHDVVEAALQWIYNNSTAEARDVKHAVLIDALACRLNIKGLGQRLTKDAFSILDNENVVKTFKYSDKHRASTMRRACARYIANNIATMRKSGQFLKLNKDQQNEIFSLAATLTPKGRA